MNADFDLSHPRVRRVAEAGLDPRLTGMAPSSPGYAMAVDHARHEALRFCLMADAAINNSAQHSPQPEAPGSEPAVAAVLDMPFWALIVAAFLGTAGAELLAALVLWGAMPMISAAFG